MGSVSNDESIICILQYGGRAVLEERMMKVVDIMSLQDLTLQHVGHDDE